MTNAAARFRPAALADAEAVTTLVNERELLDRGVTEATVAAIRAQWTTAEVEIRADALIGEIDGRIACAALATRDRSTRTSRPLTRDVDSGRGCWTG